MRASPARARVPGRHGTATPAGARSTAPRGGTSSPGSGSVASAGAACSCTPAARGGAAPRPTAAWHYHTRGRVVCANNLEVPLEATDHAVLTAVEHDVLRVEVLETALSKAMEPLQPAREVGDGPQEHRSARSSPGWRPRSAAWPHAIAAGGDLPALLALLQERERRRAYVRGELAGSTASGPPRRARDCDMGRVLDSLREQLTDWQGLLRQEAPQARQALSALLAGRLIFTPRGEGRALLRIHRPGTLSKVIAGLALPMELVPPG